MSIFKIPETHTYAAMAAADLRTSLNLLMVVNSAGKIAVAGSGVACLGTLIEVANTDQPASVQFGGICKVVAGAAVAAGARVQSDGAGKGITLAGGVAFGIALAAATAADQVIPVAVI